MFHRTQPKIEFLKERGVVNINKHIEWLKGQLKEKETEIGEE